MVSGCKDNNLFFLFILLIFLPIYWITDNVFRNVFEFYFIPNDMIMIIGLPQRIVFVEFRQTTYYVQP